MTTTAKAIEETNNTRVGELIASAMEEQGIGIREMSVKADTTYEHVRRIVKGEGIPSKFMLKVICDILGLDYRDAERQATTDRIEKKFGGSLPTEITGKNPELEPLDRVWGNLTDEQKTDIIKMAKMWAQRNKKG